MRYDVAAGRPPKARRPVRRDADHAEIADGPRHDRVEALGDTRSALLQARKAHHPAVIQAVADNRPMSFWSFGRHLWPSRISIGRMSGAMDTRGMKWHR